MFFEFDDGFGIGSFFFLDFEELFVCCVGNWVGLFGWSWWLVMDLDNWINLILCIVVVSLLFLFLIIYFFLKVLFWLSLVIVLLLMVFLRLGIVNFFIVWWIVLKIWVLWLFWVVICFVLGFRRVFLCLIVL